MQEITLFIVNAIRFFERKISEVNEGNTFSGRRMIILYNSPLNKVGFVIKSLQSTSHIYTYIHNSFISVVVMKMT